jgi:hypothetical protein
LAFRNSCDPDGGPKHQYPLVRERALGRIENSKVSREGYRLCVGPDDTAPCIFRCHGEVDRQEGQVLGCAKAVLVPGQTWASPDFLALPPAGRQNEKQVRLRSLWKKIVDVEVGFPRVGRTEWRKT